MSLQLNSVLCISIVLPQFLITQTNLFSHPHPSSCRLVSTPQFLVLEWEFSFSTVIPPHSSWWRLLSHIGTPFSSWICLLSSAVSWLIYGNTVSCYIWIISACSRVKRWTWITKYQNIESRILAVLSHYSSAAEKWWERKNDIKRVSNSQDEGEEKGCGNHPP